jgi:cysteine synthase
MRGHYGIADSVVDLVGNTPLVRYPTTSDAPAGSVLVKLEYLNPWGSIKDRTAISIVFDAERSGRLRPGGHVVEATSGNTGISLAAICAARGYKLTVFLPEFVSEERKVLLRMMGAEIVLTAAEHGLVGPVAKCMQYAEEHPEVFVADQTRNPSNPQAHLKTGEEIWEQTQGKVDVLVMASGTGGHLTGIARFIKEKSPSTKVVAVEPLEAAVLSGMVTPETANGNHGIIGIGPGFIPNTLDRSLIDDVVVIRVEDAYETAREAISKQGLLVGTSSGAVIHVAKVLAGRPENHGKVIVAVAASASERYLSTKLSSEAKDYVARLAPVDVPQSYITKLTRSSPSTETNK